VREESGCEIFSVVESGGRAESDTGSGADALGAVGGSETVFTCAGGGS